MNASADEFQGEIMARNTKPITERLSYRAYERIRPLLIHTGYYRIKFAIRRRLTDEPPF